MLLTSCLGWAECSHVSFSNDIVIVSNNYRELRGLPGTVNHHTAVVGTHSNAPKNNVHLSRMRSTKPPSLMKDPRGMKYPFTQGQSPA